MVFVSLLLSICMSTNRSQSEKQVRRGVEFSIYSADNEVPGTTSCIFMSSPLILPPTCLNWTCFCNFERNFKAMRVHFVFQAVNKTVQRIIDDWIIIILCRPQSLTYHNLNTEILHFRPSKVVSSLRSTGWSFPLLYLFSKLKICNQNLVNYNTYSRFSCQVVISA